MSIYDHIPAYHYNVLIEVTIHEQMIGEPLPTRDHLINCLDALPFEWVCRIVGRHDRASKPHYHIHGCVKSLQPEDDEDGFRHIGVNSKNEVESKRRWIKRRFERDIDTKGVCVKFNTDTDRKDHLPYPLKEYTTPADMPVWVHPLCIGVTPAQLESFRQFGSGIYKAEASRKDYDERKQEARKLKYAAYHEYIRSQFSVKSCESMKELKRKTLLNLKKYLIAQPDTNITDYRNIPVISEIIAYQYAEDSNIPQRALDDFLMGGDGIFDKFMNLIDPRIRHHFNDDGSLKSL
jgi:hypothetical protein